MHVAAAISDPVRRRIMSLLRDQPMSAGTIAACFEISRPAVSRHLRVLRECGLVVDETRGRQRLYRLDTAPLTPLGTWLDQFREPHVREPQFVDSWPARLDALETEVYRARRDRRSAAPHAVPDHAPDDTPDDKENTA